MTRLYLYAHGGSRNHGCEAIVRSTVNILDNLLVDEKVLISSHPEEDIEYGISKMCNIQKDRISFSRKSWRFFVAYLALKIKKDYVPLEKLAYKTTIDQINDNDIALSIGGDNYCYADVKKYEILQDIILKRGAKTVLWGCSVEPELIHNLDIANDLKRYSLITARESISYNALKEINKNTILVPDPAFTLETIQGELPPNFSVNNMVGINISPMVIENENVSGITMKNYQKLIQYILDKTEMGIALIPHVIWEYSDDRKVLKALYEQFKFSNRVILFEDHNCMETKGIISRCRFFIGARTHATIAAYSSCVPTLVVGYSVKARGIAKDIFGTEENFVVPVQNLKNDNSLLEVFKWMIANEDNIKKQLKDVMPEYCNRARNVVSSVEKILV